MSDDAELQLMAALQGIPLEQAALMQRAQRAQGLASAPSAQGQQIGRVYKASSPLEHLAAAISRYQGNKQMGALDQEWGGLAQRAQQAGLAQARTQQAEKMEPAPQEWGLPAGLRRSEGVKLLKPLESRRPVPAPWKEALVARGLDPMTIDAMDEAQAFQFLKQKEPGPDALPTQEQIARGAKLGIVPAEGEDSQHFEGAIRQAALAATDARRQGGNVYFMGSDESLYGLPSRGPVRPPVPVPAPGGGPGGFRKDKDLSTSERAALSDIAGTLKHVEALERDFKDEYAGMGLTGGVQVGLAQKLGSTGTKGQQELAEFWSRYERMINIPERHEKFGSALTPQEKASWDAARNIRPGVDPKIARKAFREIAEITRAVLKRRGDALAAEGYGADAVKAATGGVYGGEAAGPATAPKRRRYNPQTGQLE